MGTARSLVERLRTLLAAHAELVERRIILDRPWTHDDLHWGVDPQGEPELHGHELGRAARRGPVTAAGWCACHVRPPGQLGPGQLSR